MLKPLLPLLAAGALLAPAAAHADWVPPTHRVAVGVELQIEQQVDWQFDDEFDDSCSSNRIHVTGEGDESQIAATQTPVETELSYFADGAVKFDQFDDQLEMFGHSFAGRSREVEITVIGNDEPKCGGGAEPSKQEPEDCGAKQFKVGLRLVIGEEERHPVFDQPSSNGPDPYKNCPMYGPYGGRRILSGGPSTYTVDPEDESHVVIRGRNRHVAELGVKGKAITQVTWRVDLTALPPDRQPEDTPPGVQAEAVRAAAEALGAAPAAATPHRAAAPRGAKATSRRTKARRAKARKAKARARVRRK